MTNHELTFNKIKKLLKSHFPDRVTEYENGTHCTLDSDIENGIPLWIELDQNGQLIVGLGTSHLYYDPKFDDINKGFEQILLFLTCKKRRIDFYKGKLPYRHEYEYENQKGSFENYGTVLKWIFPFWKKTTKKITVQDGFIECAEIESEVDEIKNTMHNNI